jgi:hypothetical protein
VFSGLAARLSLTSTEECGDNLWLGLWRSSKLCTHLDAAVSRFVPALRAVTARRLSPELVRFAARFRTTRTLTTTGSDAGHRPFDRDSAAAASLGGVLHRRHSGTLSQAAAPGYIQHRPRGAPSAALGRSAVLTQGDDVGKRPPQKQLTTRGRRTCWSTPKRTGLAAAGMPVRLAREPRYDNGSAVFGRRVPGSRRAQGSRDSPAAGLGFVVRAPRGSSM